MAADPARLYQQLLNTGLQNKDNPLYQLLRALIDSSLSINRELRGFSPSSIIIPPNISNQPYLTHQNASLVLPNSRELLAGTNVTFDDSVANERTVDVTIPIPPPDQDYVVLSDGTTGSSSSESGAHVFFDTNIIINDSVETIIDWTDELIDENNYWNIANPSRLTILADGWYTILGQITTIATAAGQIAVAIIMDGTTEIARFDNFFTPVNNATQVTTTFYLTAGQFVEIEVLIVSADPTMDILAGDFSSFFQIFRSGVASISPSPVNDGFGNFVYVPYTP